MIDIIDKLNISMIRNPTTMTTIVPIKVLNIYLTVTIYHLNINQLMLRSG